MPDLDITPKTKVAQLLDAYPQLEDVLIQQSPSFEKLKNPILRKTVAKVATLKIACGMAGISVDELVAILRKHVGQEPLPAQSVTEDEKTPVDSTQEKISDNDRPDWVISGSIRNTIDADELLATGVHPLEGIQQQAGELSDNDVLVVVSSFKPTPLHDALKSAGYRIHSSERDDGKFETVIGKSE